MKTLVNQLDSHPLLALMLSLLGISAGFGLKLANPVLMDVATSPETIDYVVKIFQIIAYAGGGLAGFVSFHGWYVKNRNKKPK